MRRTESAAQEQKVRTLHASFSKRNGSIRRVGMRNAFSTEAL